MENYPTNQFDLLHAEAGDYTVTEVAEDDTVAGIEVAWKQDRFLPISGEIPPAQTEFSLSVGDSIRIDNREQNIVEYRGKYYLLPHGQTDILGKVKLQLAS